MKRPCPGDFPDRGVFVYQIKVSEQVGGEEQKRCGGYAIRTILVPPMGVELQPVPR